MKSKKIKALLDALEQDPAKFTHVNVVSVFKVGGETIYARLQFLIGDEDYLYPSLTLDVEFRSETVSLTGLHYDGSPVGVYLAKRKFFVHVIPQLAFDAIYKFLETQNNAD